MILFEFKKVCQSLKTEHIFYDVNASKCCIVCPGCKEIMTINSSSNGISGVLSFSVHNFARHLKTCKGQKIVDSSIMNPTQRSEQNSMTSMNSIDSRDDVQAVLSESRSKVESLNQLMLEKENEIAKMRTEIDNLCIQINKNDETKEEMGRLNELVAKKDTELSKMRETINQKDVESTNQLVSAQKITIAELQSDIASQINKNTATQQEIENLNSLLVERDRALSSSRAIISQDAFVLNKMMTEKANEIERLQSEIDILNSQINPIESCSKMESMNSLVSEQKTTIAKLQLDIVSLESLVAERDNALVDLRTIVDQNAKSDAHKSTGKINSIFVILNLNLVQIAKISL